MPDPKRLTVKDIPTNEQIQSHLDEHGISLSHSEVQELSKALGLNINSSEMLVSRVKAMTALDIDGLEIVLEPALLQRLKSRCVRQGFQPFLAAEITRQLRAFVGM